MLVSFAVFGRAPARRRPNAWQFKGEAPPGKGRGSLEEVFGEVARTLTKPLRRPLVVFRFRLPHLVLRDPQGRTMIVEIPRGAPP
jgi:hypothetical protein